VALVALTLSPSCTPKIVYPGNEDLGNFSFTGVRISSTCAFDFSDGGGLDGPLSFTGVFSVDVDSGAFYLTVGSSSHAGSLVDSSFKIVEEPAFRDLGCESMGNEVDETITGEFFDAAQAQRMGDGCQPTDGGSSQDGGPSDAGAPDGGTADAGASDGGAEDGGAASGFDDGGSKTPVLVCGQLMNIVKADLDAGCDQTDAGYPCAVIYSIIGKTQP
jgi:hypothetical protein